MSGGSLNYFYSTLEDHIGDFNDKELDHLVADLAELFRAREWYLSGDTGEGDWNEARDEFKQKWFSQSGREMRIEKYLSEITTEVRQMFGLNHKYCRTCKYWEQKDDSKYGKCAFQKHCLTHRSESCDKWSGRN